MCKLWYLCEVFYMYLQVRKKLSSKPHILKTSSADIPYVPEVRCWQHPSFLTLYTWDQGLASQKAGRPTYLAVLFLLLSSLALFIQLCSFPQLSPIFRSLWGLGGLEGKSHWLSVSFPRKGFPGDEHCCVWGLHLPHSHTPSTHHCGTQTKGSSSTLNGRKKVKENRKSLSREHVWSNERRLL